jgi:hypothetical protein
LDQVALILTAACELDDGPAISDEEAIALKAEHRDVLWKACVAALQVCRGTPQKVLDILQPRASITVLTETEDGDTALREGAGFTIPLHRANRSNPL